MNIRTHDFWATVYAQDFGWGWEQLLTADPYDTDDDSRFVSESDVSDSNRDHDLGFGCEYGVEWTDEGIPWHVCYAHDAQWNFGHFERP